MASDAVVTLVVDATGAQAQITADLNRIVNTAERNAPTINLSVTIDNRELNDTLTQLVASLNDTRRSSDDTDGSVSRLGATFSRMGSTALGAVTSAARIGLVGSLATTALPAVGALVAGLANIAPAAAAGVTAFVGLKAATLTLKVGLTGVEDALSEVFATEPDAEALAAALEKLAPEARSFVLEMQKLRPALDGIRLDTQNRLFEGLDVQLKNTASVTLPLLRRTALGFARDFNLVGKNVAASAQTLSRDGTLVNALDSSSAAFTKLVRIPGQLLTAIFRVAAGGGPLLVRIADRISKVADSLTNRLDRAAKSGALKESIDQAAAAIRQMGAVAGNVFGAIGNIMSIAADAGGGLFGSLERITQALEDLTATDGFRQTLTALITTGQTLISNVLPLLGAAFRIIGPIITQLAPPVQALLDLIGARLLETLNLLAPTFTVLGEAVANLITALSPIVDLFFTLLNAILPVLTPLFQALNDIIVVLAPIIQALATQLADALVPVIEALIPIVTLLAEFIADVAVALAPLVAELVPLIVGLMLRWAPVITQVLEALTPLIAGVLKFALFLVEQLVPALITVIDWVKEVGARYQELVGKTINQILLPALQAIVDLLNGDYSQAWSGAKQVAVTAGIGMATSVRSSLDGIKNQFIILSARLPTMAGTALNGVVRAFDAVAPNVARGAARVVSVAVQRFGDFNSAAFRAGQQLVISMANGIVSQIGAAVSAMRSAVSRVADLLPHSPARTGPFSGRGYPLYSGHAIMNSLAEGISARAGVVSDAMQSALSGSPLAAPALAGTTASAGFGRAVTGVLSTSVAAPNVSVYLGNELLTDRMRVVVDNQLTDRDRQAAQGVRY